MLLLPERTLSSIDTVHHCDALTLLNAMPANSVNCVVTSPPYFGLRDYGVVGQIGLEPTPQEYIARLVNVFRGVMRVLRDDGVIWVNMGDSYANDEKWGGSTGGKHVSNLHGNSGIGRAKRETGIAPKNLLGMPWRLAFALQDDGWILRSDVIWSKPNPMPESVTDRPTKAHEYVFLLSKGERYFYDADAIREESAPSSIERSKYNGIATDRPKAAKGVEEGVWCGLPGTAKMYGQGRNRRTVWTVATEPTPFAHFATFPQKLIEPMILAGCPVGGITLDPFMGSGTTALVARRLGRHYVGSELNEDYVALARERLAVPYTIPMLLETIERGA